MAKKQATDSWFFLIISFFMHQIHLDFINVQHPLIFTMENIFDIRHTDAAMYWILNRDHKVVSKGCWGLPSFLVYFICSFCLGFKTKM